MEKIGRTCGVSSCERPHKGLGFCQLHLERLRSTGSTDAPVKQACAVDGCSNKHASKGLCAMHGRRKAKTGSTEGAQPRDCKHCGISFTPSQRKPHAEACSTRCRNRIAYAARKSLAPYQPCARCSKLFTPLLPSGAFCSRECASATTVEGRASEKECTGCGGIFFSKAHFPVCKQCSYSKRLERTHARNKQRRYLRRGADGPTHTDADWIALLARYLGKCAYCQTRPAEHKDHVMPICRGGKDSVGNILPACAACNLSKGGSLLIEWKMRQLNGRKKAKTNGASANRGQSR